MEWLTILVLGMIVIGIHHVGNQSEDNDFLTFIRKELDELDNKEK